MANERVIVKRLYAGLPGRVSGCLVQIAEQGDVLVCGSDHFVRGGVPWLPKDCKPLLGARVDDLSETSLHRFFETAQLDELMDRGFARFEVTGACPALAGWEEVATSPPEAWIFRFDD